MRTVVDCVSSFIPLLSTAVSYTHLDVYKRQQQLQRKAPLQKSKVVITCKTDHNIRTIPTVADKALDLIKVHNGEMVLL